MKKSKLVGGHVTNSKNVKSLLQNSGTSKQSSNKEVGKVVSRNDSKFAKNPGTAPEKKPRIK